MEMVEAIVTIAGGVISRKEIIDLAELFYIAKCQAQKCEGLHDYLMLFMTVYRMYFAPSRVEMPVITPDRIKAAGSHVLA